MDEKALEKIEQEILGTIAAGDLELAKVTYNRDYLPIRRKQEAVISEIEKETGREKQAALAAAERSYAMARTTTWALVVGVGGLGLVVSLILARNLARPLVRVAESMRRAAQGDLADSLEFDDRTDEIGEMSRSVNETYAYLSRRWPGWRMPSRAGTSRRASPRAPPRTASARRSRPWCSSSRR